MITAEEITILWSIIGKAGVAMGAIVGIIKGFDYLYKKMPVSKLEERVKDCELHDQKDNKRLIDIETRVGVLESKLGDTNMEIEHVNEGIQRIGISQISLLRHLVTGNGQKDLEKEADDLTEFFINHGRTE